MKEIFTAKSIEEAKHLAAEKFGVSEDQIVYRILEEPKKGLFGKIKREAQVEAVYEEPAAAAAVDLPRYSFSAQFDHGLRRAAVVESFSR